MAEPSLWRLFARNLHPAWIADVETSRILEVNDAAVARYGHTREAFLARRLVDLLAPEEVMRLTVASGEDAVSAWTGEWRHRAADGRPLDVELSAHAVVFDGRPAMLVVVEAMPGLPDVAESAAQYRAVVDSLKQVIFRTDARGAWTFLNAAWTEITGFTVEESLGRSFLHYVHPDDRQRHAEFFQPLDARHYSAQVARYLTRAGDCRWIEVLARLVVDADGSVQGMLGTLTDVTDRRRAEEERVRLSSVIEQSPEAIVITDAEGTIEYVNPACQRLTGYGDDELVGQPARIFEETAQDADAFAGMLARLAAGEAWSGTVAHRRKDGALFHAETVVSPVRDAAGAVAGYVASVRDVTQQRQVEEQLRQAQKMEIAGRLAGGVAHDFNNLLTVITGRSLLLMHYFDPDDPRRRDVQLIEETAQRAAALTRQLLLFSRKQALAQRVLDLGAVVSNMERMLRRLIGEDIELARRAGPDLGRVKADPSQVEQVIMNLAVNARDAMPRGGRLTLETANVELDEAFARDHVGVRPGPYIMLAVSDTGCGMDTGLQARIFEPFFTTKAPDKGTGLGLSTVYGIVKQAGGHITVESAPGQGTTFRVYLPRAEGRPEALAPRAAGLTAPRGTETVLLVEDEEEVRDLAREVLLMAGYTVLEARHGAEALELAERHGGPLHLLLTDVVMPQLGGRELATRLARSRPEIRVVYMSGYTDDVPAEEGLLVKPFTPSGLARRVREALEAPPQRPLDTADVLLAHGRR